LPLNQSIMDCNRSSISYSFYTSLTTSATSAAHGNVHSSIVDVDYVVSTL
jgi:hypothetical protein